MLRRKLHHGSGRRSAIHNTTVARLRTKRKQRLQHCHESQKETRLMRCHCLGLWGLLAGCEPSTNGADPRGYDWMRIPSMVKSSMVPRVPRLLHTHCKTDRRTGVDGTRIVQKLVSPLHNVKRLSAPWLLWSRRRRCDVDLVCLVSEQNNCLCGNNNG